MSYYWIITKDMLDTNKDYSAVGIEGPAGNRRTKENPVKFNMYDDDDNCYYEGMLYGDYEGFEPLDDFGMPHTGCTYIKINGELI